MTALLIAVGFLAVLTLLWLILAALVGFDTRRALSVVALAVWRLVFFGALAVLAVYSWPTMYQNARQLFRALF